MKVKLFLSDEAIAASVRERGEMPGRETVLDVDASVLSDAARAALGRGRLGHGGIWTLPASSKEMPGEWKAPVCPASPQEWETLLTAYEQARQEADAADLIRKAELVRAEAERQAERQARREQEEEKMAAVAAAFLADPAARASSYPGSGARIQGWDFPGDTPAAAEALRRKNADTEAEAAAKRLAEQERRDWIEAHGSAYLKKAVRADYDCQRQYVIERAAAELPGYLVDFTDDAVWKSRNCPTEALLDEELALTAQGREAEVVWLTDPGKSGREALGMAADSYEWEDAFIAREAIVVRKFLGKYDLFKLA